MLRRYAPPCYLLVLVGYIGCGAEMGSDRRPAATPLTESVEFRSAAPSKHDSLEQLRYQAPPAALTSAPGPTADAGQGPGMGGDRYSLIVEKGFIAVPDQPLSTFSIDVDTASYSKARLYLLQQGALPPPDAIRIEEWVNYFDYAYAPPGGKEPFATHVEVARCPWQPRHRLARIGIKGRELDDERPVCNLVFLLDVSGSMNSPYKLGLVQQSMRLLASQLSERDRVAIVVYAGAAGLVLPATHGDQKAVLLSAIDQLRAGGSTNGGQGIQLAFRVAKENFVQGGSNRVILCTDGDFNVGVTSTGELVRMAEAEAKSGVFLSVLGFGMGNHNDALLEELSNKANGTYAFIDNESEARKVFVDQIGGTLVTIAKDVKIQVEFNPAQVASYRLLGYENRMLAAHEFNDDRKDAGEIGAGHTVTALYELVPADVEDSHTAARVDPLKYQGPRSNSPLPWKDELMTVKLRYKQPDSDTSSLTTCVVPADEKSFSDASGDFRFAASVAEFGMLLRKSEHCPDADFGEVLEIAAAATGPDRHGYRREFLELVRCASRLSGHPVPANGSYVPPIAPLPTMTGSPQPVYVGTAAPRPAPTSVWPTLALAVIGYLTLSALLGLCCCLVAAWLTLRSAALRKAACHSLVK